MRTILKTKGDFQRRINRIKKVTAVHFSAECVEQCGQINDLFDSLSEYHDLSDVDFVTCMAEDHAELHVKYKIEAVPTVILFRAQKILDRIDRADTVSITRNVKIARSEISLSGYLIEDRLEDLINQSKVMLFIKSDPWTPRSDSQQMISILNETGVKYDTFDVLNDEEVCEGLKTYSACPTYPQLYVNGELYGGLDIVKELHAWGELLPILNS